MKSVLLALACGLVCTLILAEEFLNDQILPLFGCQKWDPKTLSAASRWFQAPPNPGFGREGGRNVTGLKGRAIQPQATYIHQPQLREFHGHLQKLLGRLLVQEAGAAQDLDGHKDDARPLSWPEVSAKGLWQEGREWRPVPASAQRVLLGWAARAALARGAGQCWRQWPQESWQQCPQSLCRGG